MMQVEMFYRASPDAIKADINEWLLDHPSAEVYFIEQSLVMNPAQRVLISIWYTEYNRQWRNEYDDGRGTDQAIEEVPQDGRGSPSE